MAGAVEVEETRHRKVKAPALTILQVIELLQRP